MSWKKLDPNLKANISAFTISGILIVLFYLIIKNLPAIGNGIGVMLKALMPFLIGMLLALIMTPLRRWIEKKVMKNVHWRARTKRRVATLLCLIVVLLVLAAFFAIIMPQLISSLKSFAENLQSYIDSIEKALAKLSVSDPELRDNIQKMIRTGSDQLTSWLTGAQGGLTKIISFSVSVVKNIINFFIGLIIMFYLLLDEEKFKHQVKKLAYGAFPEKAGDEIMYVGRLSVRMFNSFIAGKAVDSLIIGIVCWLVVTILQMPYAPMIGFIVGITNMIPVFGPFIGAIPCLIILLIINPWQSLEFLIFIIILQQVDGNIIGPHILGDSMGLPTLWVMFAIIVGGALFGVVGMFLGVPIFSVIYTLVANALNRRMMENQIDLNTK
ncbi:MAG: AI-2E family transporter [Erysipelotrichaceae bacterium]|jgi:predicted PurR-regulated permease PerM|nr:AI-2E family transporter [Erysipelotrichaceae bacterium]MCI1326519.1 AI-2E family transporter [Solobacterium sp.]MCH4044553.1 AI-2E family transporter [Erysipelotrichaceae bacterium]MCH4121765.1 AI-2E family transporter [Erysipelotrichaceae bacterium]MCI1363217.1 AI-2E family transporter [Solobacterium sp.]